MESPAVGLTALAAGPDDQLAFASPVTRQVFLLRAGKVMHVVDVRADGLAFLDNGKLVATDQRLRMLKVIDAASGRILSSVEIPGIIPPDSTIVVEGKTLYAEDVFGNRHLVGVAGADNIVPTTKPAMLAPAHKITQKESSKGTTLRVDNVSYNLTGVKGTVVGTQAIGGSPPVLLVDVDNGEQTTRYLVRSGVMPAPLPSVEASGLPIELAVGPDGRIVALSVTADGLALGCVTRPPVGGAVLEVSPDIRTDIVDSVRRESILITRPRPTPAGPQ